VQSEPVYQNWAVMDPPLAKDLNPPSDQRMLTRISVREALVALLGAAALIAGGVAAFVSSNGAGSAGLSASGATLLILVLLGEKIEWLKVGSVEVHLREAARGLSREADRLEAQGDTQAAARLREEAVRLLLRASPAARAYEELRRTQAPTPERVLQLSELVSAARRHARVERPAAEAVIRAFVNGGDGERVYALGLMQEKPDATYLDSIVDAIRQSHSAFEQGEALTAALQIAPLLNSDGKTRLRDLIQEQLNSDGYIARSTYRRGLSEHLLSKLDGDLLSLFYT
jgi:hypothetical protein